MENEYEYIFGKHAVYEALVEKPEIVRKLFLDPKLNLDPKTQALIQRLKLTVKELDFKKLPPGITAKTVHQGMVAEINPNKLMLPYKQFIENLQVNENTALLVLGEVQDPHNVGAVIRSAAAFGISAVLIPPHKQAPVTGTVIKVSAGMAFRVPLVTISNVNSVMRDLQKRGFWTYGLAGDGEVSVTAEDFSKPSVFVLGNEGTGLRKKTGELCDNLLSIPIHPRCESLNASVATAVVLAAWSKQHPQAISKNL